MKLRLAVAASALLLFAACLPWQAASHDPVSFAVTPNTNNGVLTLRGATSLMDGALVGCEVWHESEDLGLGSGRFMTLAESAVEMGTFACAVDIADWPLGAIRASVTFSPYEQGQPVFVRDAYGAEGEFLSGPSATSTSDGRQLRVLVDVPR